jgi:hypothetical protein
MDEDSRAAQLGQGLVVAIAAVAQDGGSFLIKAATSKGERDMGEAQGKGRARGEEWRDLQGRDPSEALREILATEEEEDLEGGAAAT